VAVNGVPRWAVAVDRGGHRLGDDGADLGRPDIEPDDEVLSPRALDG
jgi:hypothetical protein